MQVNVALTIPSIFDALFTTLKFFSYYTHDMGFLSLDGEHCI